MLHKRFHVEYRLRRVPLYDVVQVQRDRDAYATWLQTGRKIPPPHIVKQEIIKSYAQRFDITTLVETGTYYGDMVAALGPFFTRIITIELSEMLHAKAVGRFAGAKNVTLLQGDSGEVLANYLPQLNEPAIFWLDGHYSGGPTATISDAVQTPVKQELDLIFQHPLAKSHVVLIDDARCFTGELGYPKVEWIQAQCVSVFDTFDNRHDVIRAFNSRGS